MNPYPATAEAVDNHLSNAIKGLEKTTEKGFDRVERRLESTASKDAVEAQITRLDLRIDHSNENTAERLKSLDLKMDSGFQAIEERDAKRDAAAEKRDDERDKKFSRRMTWTLTVVGLSFTAFQLFIAPLIERAYSG